MMENKSQLSIAEIDVMYQSMSAAELWQRGKGVEPLHVKYIEQAGETPDDEDDFVQSSSKSYLIPETELWAFSEDSEFIQIHAKKAEMVTPEKILAIMEKTYLSYETVEIILCEPKRATLGDIAVYCKKMDIHLLEFMEKVLA